MLSEYEKRREANLERNAAFLKNLGAFPALDKKASPTKPSPRKRKAEEQPAGPPRKSLRTQGLAPDGTEVAKKTAPPQADERRDRERRKGTLRFAECVFDEDVTPVDQLDNHAVVAATSSLSNASRRHAKFTRGPADYARLVSPSALLGKVTPERIYSLCWHPDPTHLVGMVGDKWGRIGIIALGSPDALDLSQPSLPEESVLVLAPHKLPVSCLCVSPSNRNHVFSACYDGSVRCTDLAKQTISEAFVHSEESGRMSNLFALSFVSTGNAFVVCDGGGLLHVVDPRAKVGAGVARVEAHDNKKVSDVRVLPDDNLVASCSHDHTVKLWDLRKLSSPGPQRKSTGRSKSVVRRIKPVATLPHGASLISLALSRSGKFLVSVCADDKVRVWNDPAGLEGTAAGKPSHVLSHRNNTGRFVTNLRAQFDPVNEDMLVLGALDKPRCCDVINARTGRIQCKIAHENLTALAPLNELHPASHAMLSANGSGRVNVWVPEPDHDENDSE